MNRDAWLWLGFGSFALWLLHHSAPFPDSTDETLALPVDGPLRVTPHGYFGAPRAGPPRHSHQGIDVAAAPGSFVRAIGDGVIVRTAPGLGKIVRKLQLDMPARWKPGARAVGAVVYADLGTPLVQPGERVRRGQPLARVAAAGFVHFAVKELHARRELFFDPAEAGLDYRLIQRPNVA